MKYLSQQSQQASRDDNLDRGDLTDQPGGGDTAGLALCSWPKTAYAQKFEKCVRFCAPVFFGLEWVYVSGEKWNF